MVIMVSYQEKRANHQQVEENNSFPIIKSESTKQRMQITTRKEDKIAFLCTTSFGSGKVTIIHHFKQIGGNIGAEEEFFGAIQGLRKITAHVS